MLTKEEIEAFMEDGAEGDYVAVRPSYSSQPMSTAGFRAMNMATRAQISMLRNWSRLVFSPRG